MRRSGISLLALALAALPATAEVIDLEDIVVSANKTPVAAGRTGVSVSVVSEAELAAAGAEPLAAVLARVPGVSLAQSGPAGTQANLRIRGAEPRYVAVYIDGVRVDDPTGIAAEFDFGALSAADVARVEILRGSQSALWGGSAVGGVINITSRAALKDGLSQSVALEAGSYGTLAARYDLGWKTARQETSFTLSHRRSNGYSAFDTLPRNKALEPDGMKATRLGFATRYAVSDALAVGVSGFVQDTENDYDGFGADAANNQKRREFGARVFAEYSMGNSTHVLEATRYRVSRDQFAAGVPNGSFTGVRTGFAYKGTTEVSPRLTLVYGAETSEETAVNAALPAGGATRISGVWAQGLLRPTDAIDLSAALRYDHNSRFGSQPSGRFAFAWEVSPAVTLRGAAATGFRAPSLYEQFGDPRFTIAANGALTPEKSRSVELGADVTVGAGASFGVTLFQIHTSNAITYSSCPSGPPTWSCAPGTFNQYVNTPGTSKRRGVELSGRVALGQAADLSMGYTYVDARNPTGGRLLRVPRHSLNLTLDGRLTDRLSGSVSVMHAAGRPAEFGAVLADYTVVSAGLRYDLAADTQLSLRVDNLFDKDWQSVPGYGTSGRAVYLGLKKSF